MKQFILILLVIKSFNAIGQDCTEELLRKKAGTWKAGLKGSVNNITAADLAKEKSVIAAIHKMLTTNYIPTGCEVNCSNTFGKYPLEGQTYIADPYQYTMYILPYLCDPNSADKSKSYVAIATATTVNITANINFTLNNLYAANIPPDDFRGYLKLKQRPQKKDGAWFMGEEVVGDRGTPYEINEYRWMITYDEQLPFTYVNRKEYLLIQKKRMEQTIRDDGPGEYNKQFINAINNQLKLPEAELTRPAICLWNDEQRFTRFVEEGTRGSFIAIKPNLDYYNRKLPKSSPQFFTVVYKISKGDPVLEDNMKAIVKAVDFKVLQNMLGK